MDKRCLAFALVCSVFVLLAPVFAADTPSKATETERIQKAAEVFKEINAVPEKSIPRELLESAQCVVIIPSMVKGGFIFGGRYGRGVVSCREASGKWSPPSMEMIAGGSFGAQIGGQEVDLVLLAMNQKGKDALLSNKFTIGAGVSGSAGPVGRTAEASTNVGMQAEFLSYSRSRGAFIGATLDGATLRPDDGGNQALYGRSVTARQILMGQVPMPAAAQLLVSELSTYARPEARR